MATLEPHSPSVVLANSEEADPSARVALAELARTLDARLQAARPRLLALARLRGLSADDAEEVAQESLLVAWRNLATLREPQRFDAWLDGICRNVCLRAQSIGARYGIHLDPLPQDGDDTSADDMAGGADELADPAAVDLDEELCRADLQTLVDRALAHVSAPTRAALVLSYLEEQPQAEVALRLGVSRSALEARLHRARRELRQVLAGPLRAEAESFGLLVGQDEAEGWRETREWCVVCGQHRMRGTFETMPDGTVALRMRCPVCSARWQADIVNSGGMVSLGSLRSFRPAIWRVFGSETVHKLTTLEEVCPLCGGPGHKRVTDDLDNTMPGRYYIVSECPRCGVAASWLVNASWARPETREWVSRHERYIVLPDTPATFEGVPVIRVRFAAIPGPATLDVFIDPTTLVTLGSVEA